MGRSSEGSGVTHEKCTLDATNEARRAPGRAPRARSGNRCGRVRQASGEGSRPVHRVNHLVAFGPHYFGASRLQGRFLLASSKKNAKKRQVFKTRNGKGAWGG